MYVWLYEEQLFLHMASTSVEDSFKVDGQVYFSLYGPLKMCQHKYIHMNRQEMFYYIFDHSYELTRNSIHTR